MSNLQKQTPQELLSPQGFDQMQRISKALSTSDIIPKEFKDKIANCMVACMAASDMNKTPFFIMQNACVIHGKLSWNSTYIISAINVSGIFTPLRFRYSKDKTECTAYATEIQTGEVVEGITVTMEMATAEGWATKTGSKWKTMPQLMLQYRAATFFGRAYVPHVLNGMQTADEAQDVNGYHEESNKVQDLNDKLKHEEAPVEDGIEDAEEITDDELTD
jgi:hypothetical protein